MDKIATAVATAIQRQAQQWGIAVPHAMVTHFEAELPRLVAQSAAEPDHKMRSVRENDGVVLQLTLIATFGENAWNYALVSFRDDQKVEAELTLADGLFSRDSRDQFCIGYRVADGVGTLECEMTPVEVGILEWYDEPGAGWKTDTKYPYNEK
ncbi:MAG TPA: hypothetical protein EYP98_11650 [Planctomycetes bacterium]|jgi:hypothetical protein|nr:hypothetical protein [Planctomycetota bacterium]